MHKIVYIKLWFLWNKRLQTIVSNLSTNFVQRQSKYICHYPTDAMTSWWKHSVEHSSEIKVPFDQNGTACGVIGENSLLKGNPTILGSFPEQKSVSFPTRRFLKFTGRIQRFIAWSACDKSPRFMEHSCSLYQGLFSHSMKMTHQCKKIN